MYPLVIFSVVTWVIIFERIWNFRKLGNSLRAFYLEASNILLRGDRDALKSLCQNHSDLPTSKLLTLALERQSSKDERLRKNWLEALDRRRLLINQELKQNLWILGTIGSASPFVGLFGTVVGILRSFHEMARTGSGGFTVVAAGISESLIATAAGIVVAVIAVMAFNAFQTRWNTLVLTIKIHMEELVDILSGTPHGS